MQLDRVAMRIVIAASVVAGGAISQAAGAVAAPSLASSCTWSTQTSPNPAGGDNSLQAVAALSPSNAWAVGTSIDNNDRVHGLVEHWNGSVWKIVSVPQRGSLLNEFNAVAGSSASDIWIVGDSEVGNSPKRTLIEHWNGSSWSIVPSPNDDRRAWNLLWGVSVISSTDAWAVGNGAGPVIEHWNGVSWKLVSSPSVANGAGTGVAATAAGNVWMVGVHGSKTLTEHWNGAAWRVVSSPTPGPQHSAYVSAVSAVSQSNAWLVGQINTTDQTSKPLTEHWNGTAWKVFTAATKGASANFNGVAATSTSNAWAVGGYNAADFTGGTLIEHWNGSSWKVVSSPNPGSGGSLYSVAATSASNAWAVGYYESNSGHGHTLILHCG